MQPLIFTKETTFWYETLRSFGHIAYGGADFGEVVTTAQRIAEGDHDSWHDEWLLAPRAAAFEPRVKALIAFDGVYDMGALIAADFGGDSAATRAALEHPEAEEFIRGMMAQNPAARWAFAHGAWVTGSTPAGYALKMLDYHLREGVAEGIACPTLVCAAPADVSFRGRPEALYST
jgi:hypothetical protein